MHWDYRKNPILQTEGAKKAMDIADQFIKSIGIENTIINDMYAVKPELTSKDIVGYHIIYSRRFNDIVIPQNINMGGSTMQADDDFVCPFGSERLVVEVEGDEIVYFEWDNMFQLDTTLSENIELMSFDEVIANSENQLAAKYAYVEDWDESNELYVDKILLSYAVESIKDRKYEYMLIPVWAFYGGYDFGEGHKFSDGTVLKGKHRESVSFLTINAVDGSVICGDIR